MQIQIPEGVNVQVQNNAIKVKGPQGEVERKLSPLVSVNVNGAEVVIQGKSKALVNTTEAHLKNMFKGVKSGFRIRLKVIFAHFPMTIEVKGKDITIKNFLGEKQPRKTKLIGNTKIEVKQKEQEVIVSGADKDAIGATIANMRIATKIKDKDARVFQDGLYFIE